MKKGFEDVVSAITQGRSLQVTWPNGTTRRYTVEEYCLLSAEALEGAQVHIVGDEYDFWNPEDVW